MERPGQVFSSYRSIVSSRTAEELAELAHIKRFLELVTGDPDFRAKLTEQREFPQALAAEYGCSVDPLLMRPLWDRQFAGFRNDLTDDRWPLARRWDAYLTEMLACRGEMRLLGDTRDVNPNYSAWRDRQIGRVRSELGEAGSDGIVHPVVAFELSKGCSVGCWFCGVSAEKFEGHFPYTRQNADLWADVLRYLKRRFGEASKAAFCYWATDPVDNPDYSKFVEAFRDIVGVVPQTTTAAPMRNVDRVREILRISKGSQFVPDRFSILTLGMLRRVLKEFSPEELLGVELVQHQREANNTKAYAGRAFERDQAGAEPRKKRLDPTTPGTIACVSGFLVNMVEGTIRLVAPTRARKEWPSGYIVFDEARFSSADEFETAVERMMLAHMQPSLLSSAPIRLRSDLHVSRTDGDICLKNDRITYRLAESAAFLDIIQRGRFTVADVVSQATREGLDPFKSMFFMEAAYRQGILVDHELC